MFEVRGEIFQADLNRWFTKLRRIERSMKLAIKLEIMDWAAKKLEEEARARCPIDEGDLEKDIKSSTLVSGTSYEAALYLDPNGPSKEYQEIIHDSYYSIGPLSRQKQAATGKQVGRKFMTRAVNESRLAIYSHANAVIRRVLSDS